MLNMLSNISAYAWTFGGGGVADCGVPSRVTGYNMP